MGKHCDASKQNRNAAANFHFSDSWMFFGHCFPVRFFSASQNARGFFFLIISSLIRVVFFFTSLHYEPLLSVEWASIAVWKCVSCPSNKKPNTKLWSSMECLKCRLAMEEAIGFFSCLDFAAKHGRSVVCANGQKRQTKLSQIIRKHRSRPSDTFDLRMKFICLPRPIFFALVGVWLVHRSAKYQMQLHLLWALVEMSSANSKINDCNSEHDELHTV